MRISRVQTTGLTGALCWLACALPGVAAGTASVGAPAVLVWPEPPAEARIQYVQSASSPSDLGVRPSFWGRIGGFLTGSRRDRETFGKPFGVSVDAKGNLCVTDTGAGVVWILDRIDRGFRRFDSIGETRLQCPVAAIREDDRLFVADSVLGKVFISDLKGKMLAEIADLERPSGLTRCDGKLFVADAGAHCVAVFDDRGTLLRRFGKRGGEAGEFNAPTHITADSANRLLVTDSLNSRIQVFDLEGRHLKTIGGPGDATGRFSRPKGIAADTAAHLYVADALHDNIQIFNEAGQLLLYWGNAGQGPGEFWMPAGLAVSRQNEIFVADSYNRRIQVFQYVGKE